MTRIFVLGADARGAGLASAFDLAERADENLAGTYGAGRSR